MKKERWKRKVAGLLAGVMVLTGPISMNAFAQVSARDDHLVVHYDFENVTGTTVPDTSGRKQNAAIHGSAAQIKDGKSGKGLLLNPNFENNGYAQLPAGIVQDLTDYTVTAWVNVNQYAAWSRIFDFGHDSNRYMFFAPANSGAGGDMQFAVTTGGSGKEQRVNVATKFRLGEWTHLAVTQKANVVTVYINGEHAVTCDVFEHTPKSAIGNSTSNYIGKSQFASDAYFNGTIDDFRIYDTALTDAEILQVKGECEQPVAEAKDVKVTARLGEQPKLPRKVKVTYKDKTNGEEPVVWSKVTEEMMASGKTYNVEGTVAAYDKKVKAVITVESDSQNSDFGIALHASHIISAPKDVTASYMVTNYSASAKNVSLVYDLYDLNGKKLEGNSEKRKVDAGFYLKEDIKYTIPIKYDPHKTELRLSVVDDDGKALADGYQYIPDDIVKGSMFEDDAVKLEEGMFKTSQELNQELFLTYDVDRLCAPLFEGTESGTGAKANRYGGWEARDIAGVSIGHYMSTAALMYEQTGKAVFKERLDYAVSEVARAQAQYGTGFVGGYLKTDGEGRSYRSAEDRFIKNVFDKPDSFEVNQYNLGGIWDCWYSIQKIFKGALEAYTLTGNEQGLEVAEKFAAWTKTQTDKLNDVQMQRMLWSEYGGMAETLVWLYQATDKKEYLTLAERFIRRTTQMDFLSQEIDHLDGFHANEQMPEVTGAAAYYTETGDKDLKTGVEFFWKTITENRLYANGGNSSYEHFPNMGGEPLTTNNSETCNTFNFLKLTEYLYSWDHDAKYMDFFENALYNHIFTTQDPLTGQKCYYTSLVPGGFRTYSTTEDSWWCCNLSGMENPARYNKMIYYKDGEDLYVNLFIASSAVWRETGMEFTQETDFPDSDTTTLHITKGADDVNVKFRVPDWTAGDVTVWINGTETEATPENGYITLSGNWSKGDEIKVRFPMDVHLYQKKDDKNSVALKYGPVLLAAPLGTKNYPATDYSNDANRYENYPALDVADFVSESRNPNEWVVRTDDKALSFTTKAIGRPGYLEVDLVPFYSIHHERYNVYWKLYNEEEYDRIKTPEDEIVDKLGAITTDTMLFGDTKSEEKHKVQVEGSGTSFNGYNEVMDSTWRDMLGAGTISCEMKTVPNDKNYIYTRYLGADGPFTLNGINYVRSFDIYVDGEKIASETLTPVTESSRIVFYEIPMKLTKGKETITLTFKADNSNQVIGGLFEFRTTTANHGTPIKTSLSKLIQDAESLKKEDYTEKSWNVFEDALARANEVNNDSGASQEEIDTVYDALDRAMGSLREAGWELPYADVAETDWFYDAVYYSFEEGLMTGLDETHFGPYESLSRAQFALILYRMEGKPNADTEKSFGDIKGDEWYGSAVLWAAKQGIVAGYENGNFGPADQITREQMTVMMYRYAKYLKNDISKTAEFDKYKDATSVSDFAKDAMRWAIGNEIITGKENGTLIDPQGNTARCETAIIIQRFLE